MKLEGVFANSALNTLALGNGSLCAIDYIIEFAVGTVVFCIVDQFEICRLEGDRSSHTFSFKLDGVTSALRGESVLRRETSRHAF